MPAPPLVDDQYLEDLTKPVFQEWLSKTWPGVLQAVANQREQTFSGSALALFLHDLSGIASTAGYEQLGQQSIQLLMTGKELDSLRVQSNHTQFTQRFNCIAELINQIQTRHAGSG